MMKIEIEAGEGEKQEEIKDYEVECALRTLIEAEGIRRKPALMSKVKELARKQKKVISSIADIKTAYAQMSKMLDEDDERSQEELDFEKQVQSE